MEKKKAMELVKTESGKALSPFQEMERGFAELLKSPLSLLVPPWIPRPWSEIAEPSPTVDIFEEDGDVIVKAELPGMEKKDIDVKLTDNTITISGEKKKEEKVEKKDFYRMERSYGSFTRSFGLPSEVQTDKAKAQFKNGILEVRVPKTEEAKMKAKKLLIE
jgi:HSP20 family protein